MRTLALTCLALLATTTGANSADKIRVLILTGESDYSPPWQPTVPFMRSMLINTGRFDVRVEEEVRGITAATLDHYDLLVQYCYGPRWGEITERAVEEFVRSGKGMIAVHGVTHGPLNEAPATAGTATGARIHTTEAVQTPQVDYRFQRRPTRLYSCMDNRKWRFVSHYWIEGLD